MSNAAPFFSVIFALLVQSGVAIWWAGGIDASVDNMQEEVRGVPERVSVLETKSDARKEQLDRIESKLDTLLGIRASQGAR